MEFTLQDIDDYFKHLDRDAYPRERPAPPQTDSSRVRHVVREMRRRAIRSRDVPAACILQRLENLTR